MCTPRWTRKSIFQAAIVRIRDLFWRISRGSRLEAAEAESPLFMLYGVLSLGLTKLDTEAHYLGKTDLFVHAAYIKTHKRDLSP